MRTLIRIIPIVLVAMLMVPSVAQAAWTRDQLANYQFIGKVFPHHRTAARHVAHCESTYRRYASNGQYHGVFQLSWSWRDYFHRHYGFALSGYHPRQNIRAAHMIFLGSGKTWQQWQCKP